ncbi:DUF4097 family beta strand repeat-containing protein [Amycolatopsis minnesotensis]|uniref:DUF4097 domain-containing protein n=1 Tax=Amycolatopsis minnesotensis TaxID=337894 RepID=A0ABP5DX76_9PSEU
MTRTITHDHTGPSALRLRLPAGRITVTATDDSDRATVRLTPQNPGDQAAVDAIEETEVTQSADGLTVTVPATGGGSSVHTVVQRGGGRVSVSQTAGIVTGSMTGVTITSDGSIFVGGRNGAMVITGGAGGGVDAEVTVPVGHHVDLAPGAADVTSTGQVTFLRVDSGSGDVHVTGAEVAEVITGSGDVTASGVRALYARTGSGDITVPEASGSVVASTGSGDVHVHLSAELPALEIRTGSGDITVTAAPGVRVDRSRLRTGSGDIHTP